MGGTVNSPTSGFISIPGIQLNGVGNNNNQNNGSNVNLKGVDADNSFNIFNTGFGGGNTTYTRQYNLGGSSGIISGGKYDSMISQINALPLEQRASYIKKEQEAGTISGDLVATYDNETGNLTGFTNKDGSSISASTLTGTQGNWGSLLGNISNVANMGIGVMNGIMSWNQYKQNKELLNKQKELLNQQITQNTENMNYVRKERERQDTMRSNVSAQRSSSSNVRSF